MGMFKLVSLIVVSSCVYVCVCGGGGGGGVLVCAFACVCVHANVCACPCIIVRVCVNERMYEDKSTRSWLKAACIV